MAQKGQKVDVAGGGSVLAIIGFLLLILFTFAWISTNDDTEPSDHPTPSHTNSQRI